MQREVFTLPTGGPSAPRTVQKSNVSWLRDSCYQYKLPLDGLSLRH